MTTADCPLKIDEMRGDCLPFLRNSDLGRLEPMRKCEYKYIDIITVGMARGARSPEARARKRPLDLLPMTIRRMNQHKVGNCLQKMVYKPSSFVIPAIIGML